MIRDIRKIANLDTPYEILVCRETAHEKQNVNYLAGNVHLAFDRVKNLIGVLSFNFYATFLVTRDVGTADLYGYWVKYIVTQNAPGNYEVTALQSNLRII